MIVCWQFWHVRFGVIKSLPGLLQPVLPKKTHATIEFGGVLSLIAFTGHPLFCNAQALLSGRIIAIAVLGQSDSQFLPRQICPIGYSHRSFCKFQNLCQFGRISRGPDAIRFGSALGADRLRALFDVGTLQLFRLLDEPACADRLSRAAYAHVESCTWTNVREQWLRAYREAGRAFQPGRARGSERAALQPK